MRDLIDRQAAIEAIDAVFPVDPTMSEYVRGITCGAALAKTYIKQLPSVQLEPLTDKEQRIFLAAMGREEEVCKEVDKGHTREAYEDSLMYICKEIKRKVKGALLT